jgi:hypothetical protein
LERTGFRERRRRRADFENGPTKLSGTLYLARSRKPQSATVVTHAAGAPLRDLSLYQHLKKMLPALGIAVFIYDRPGSRAICAPSATPLRVRLK